MLLDVGIDKESAWMDVDVGRFERSVVHTIGRVRVSGWAAFSIGPALRRSRLWPLLPFIIHCTNRTLCMASGLWHSMVCEPGRSRSHLEAGIALPMGWRMTSRFCPRWYTLVHIYGRVGLVNSSVL